jgi:hypothetical protein
VSAPQPPRLATWLLERFGTSESIVGDLVERYSVKRSPAWFWRQVLIAIPVGAARDIGHHKLLAIRAVGAGFAVLLVFSYFTRRFLNSSHGALWINGHWYQPGQLLVSFWYLWISLGGALSGWIVGHLYRAHRASMTIVFAGCVLIVDLVQLYVMLTITRPYGLLVGDFGLIALTSVMSILVGGLWVPQIVPDSPEAARSKR